MVKGQGQIAVNFKCTTLAADKGLVLLSYCSVELFFSMMTSSNWNSFRFIGCLWGESTGDWWIPITKASDVGVWCSLLTENANLAYSIGKYTNIELCTNWLSYNIMIYRYHFPYHKGNNIGCPSWIRSLANMIFYLSRRWLVCTTLIYWTGQPMSIFFRKYG